ncbi:ewing's tumor-associated antigen 1-like isoform X2 [Brienomyrus brachyistius]|uniref:ewing's tumor-associated antigen 1-like isoform X2 n=1 Tax=Brienomyrus brachyistius TaxID=42636 RepID=UPI0020B4253F|nr:ewing's tumor-associated antigen 1-like isoform X2 [Brienomyrus brachyistius]
MSGRRKHCASPSRPRLDERETQRMSMLSQNKAKSNKLSRSLRQTQQSPSLESSYNYKNEWKTPKRRTQIRLNGLNSADSPNHDIEDIIWDATSPTPVRKGKGAAKASRKAVDISEIVSRIAPAGERPSASGCKLLQWIGDSAIPCTPEVKHQRTRKKSTRQNGVEDLMKLAKQFDINMIQQEKEQAKEGDLRAAETDVGEAGTPRDCEIDPPIMLSKLGGTGEGMAPGSTNVAQQIPQKHEELRLESEDSLDVIFDRSTQPLSEGLTPNTPIQSQEMMLTPPRPSVEKAVNSVTGNLPLTSSDNANKVPKGSQDFDDDWDDDLLNDSFVLEMTLNPPHSVAPRYCSTQTDQIEKKDNRVKSLQPSTADRTAESGRLNSGGDASSFGSTVIFPVKNVKVRNRTTFKLEGNPHFQPQGTYSGTFPKGLSAGGGVPEVKTQSSFCPSHVSVATRNQGDKMTQHISNKQQERAPLRSFGVRETSVTLSSSRPPMPSVRARDRTSVGQSSLTSEKPASMGLGSAQEVTDEDLDSFFTSDSLWDDTEDDDLLYQICNDVEKTSQSAGIPSLAHAEQCRVNPNPLLGSEDGQLTRVTHRQPKSPCAFTRSFSVPASNAYVPLAPPIASHSNQSQGRAVGSASRSHTTSNTGPSGNGSRPYKFTQVRSVTVGGSTRGPVGGVQDGGEKTWPASTGSTADPPRPSSFKRHLSEPIALSTKVFVSSQVAVKCTKEEIERKKQQALARRRLRLQASQRPRAPT